MARVRVCGECGRKIDADKEGYYDNHRQMWICHKCVKKHAKAEKEQQADQREKATGMRQTKGAMIAKLIVGVIFLITSLTQDMELGARCVGIVIAAALIAWGLIPYLKAKKAKAEAAAQAAAAELQAKNSPKKCAACGAMTKGDVCEYCGAPLV